MSATAEIRSGTNAPELYITPPARWWENPVRELWEYRELLYFFVWRDIKVRYKQTVLGAAWAVLQPLLTMMMFSLFFGKLVHIPSEGLPYPIFYYAALLPWTYFASALQTGTMTIVGNQHVITKVYFPRLTLPFSAVLSGLVDFAISFAMLIALLLYYGIWPTAKVVFLPVFLLLAIATALGVSLWLSALNAMYRDVRYVVPFLVQFWMFASPVIYPSSLVPQKWRWLYGLNPMAGVIEGFRWSLTGHGNTPGVVTGVSVTAVLLVLLGGMAYFRRMEATVADVV
jgi:lipopolysaccharide transport system permease protein